MRLSPTFVEIDKTIHDRKSFTCGTEERDNFLRQFAVRHREAGISKTMVLPAKGAVVVDALDAGVQGFYEQYGFQSLDTHNRRTRLFLPMKTVAQLFNAAPPGIQ